MGETLNTPAPPPLSYHFRVGNPLSYTYGFTLFMGVRALVYPPFVLKTKMQVERGGGASMSAIRVARETVRMEGIRGLYKVQGLLTTA